MTDEQMRVIYEWAYPELKGKAWEPAVMADGATCAWFPMRDTDDVTPLRHLDMNFAFDVCIPKLRGKPGFGVRVEYHCDVGETWWLTRLDGRTYINKDFYQALLQYLEAK